MSQASRLREALNAGGPLPASKDKGPPVADGVLSVTPDTPEALDWKSRQSPIDVVCASSPYLDDHEDGAGPSSPGDLYGKFTWRIEKFSEISKRELRSTVFEVGGYKWYILVYPQGCDVCNHLSLFLCVADYDKLLPGWSHFAQFTIAVVNKDPKKSKYSDTLHRFCKKEHDWGWKKFMELSKILEGFTVQDTLVIKAQVQVIRDRPGRPFRCLDAQYRRELVRVYLTNVESICKRFLDERRERLARLGTGEGSAFAKYWSGLTPQQQQALVTERGDTLLKGLVKQFFNEKEVTSTLVMDALLCGCKQLEAGSRGVPLEAGSRGAPPEADAAAPMVLVDAERNTFTVNGCLVGALQRAAADVLPPSGRDEKESLAVRSAQEGDDSTKGCVDRDERRLADLGRRAVECFALSHILSTRVEAAFAEAECVKMQDALIREEEELGREEEKRAKERAEADKEKKLRKKARQKAKKEAERKKKEDEEAAKAAEEAAKREAAERKAREAADRRKAEDTEQQRRGNPKKPPAPPTSRRSPGTDEGDGSPDGPSHNAPSSSHRRVGSGTSGLLTSSEEDGASTSSDGEVEAVRAQLTVLEERLTRAEATAAAREAALHQREATIESQRSALEERDHALAAAQAESTSLKARLQQLERDLAAARAMVGAATNGSADGEASSRPPSRSETDTKGAAARGSEDGGEGGRGFQASQGGYRATANAGTRKDPARPAVVQAQVAARDAKGRGAHRGSLDGAPPAAGTAPYMAAGADNVLSYRNAAAAGPALGGGGHAAPVANGKNPFSGGAGQFRAPPPGYEAQMATPPSKVRPEGAIESPGLDDFAHLGLITDLLE